MIGKKDSVKMISFVLGISGVDVFQDVFLGQEFPDGAFFNGGKIFKFDLVVPVDKTPDFRDGKATFEPAVLFLFVDLT